MEAEAEVEAEAEAVQLVGNQRQPDLQVVFKSTRAKAVETPSRTTTAAVIMEWKAKIAAVMAAVTVTTVAVEAATVAVAAATVAVAAATVAVAAATAAETGASSTRSVLSVPDIAKPATFPVRV